MFKVLVLLLLVTLACSRVQRPVINSDVHLNLREGLNFGLISGWLDNLYLSADGNDCLNIVDGKCGSIVGMNISTANNVDIWSTHKGIQWTLVHSDDFFCIRSIPYNAFLYLEGQNCANLDKNQQCGVTSLFRTKEMNCIIDYGWRISMIQNYYVLQSVKYPNVYLYFNGQDCQRVTDVRKCGVFGFYLTNTQGILTSSIYKWVLFNLREISSESLISNSGH
jgi:hypothetical protein